jgi:multiple sugar transport system substrate-binding protein
MKRIVVCALILVGISVFASAALGATITYLTPETDPTSIAVDREIIRRFEEANPGVKISLSHANLEDVLPKIAAQLRAGTAPDVAFFSPRYVAGLAEQGFLLTLEDVYESLGDVPRRFITPTMDGKIYDIPISTESMGLYYRTDLFDAAGLQPPTTFEEWLEAARILTQDTDGDGRVDQYGIALVGGIPENYFAFTPILWANGGDYFDENNNIVFDSEEAIEALEFWGELSKFAPPGVSNTRWSDAAVQFSQGICAMIAYPGRILTNIERYNPEIEGKLGFAPIPAGPSADETVIKATINNFVVFKGTKHPELAKKFIEFYLAEEQYLEFLTSSVPGHALPVRSGWLENEEFFESPQIKKNQEIIKKAMGLVLEKGIDFQFRHDTVNPYLGQALADPLLSQEINNCLSGRATAEKALKTVAEQWRDMFGIQ